MNSISKQQQKYIQSLYNKKYRKQFGEFTVEGRKSILELAKGNYEIVKVYISQEQDILMLPEHVTQLVDEASIRKCSFMQNNNYGIAIVKSKSTLFPEVINEWVLAADDVGDPGNLGTMIRLADWYGIKHIICSQNTVDYQNPKVIASTMGSFARVNIWYCDLLQKIDELNLPVYAASMEGENVHQLTFPACGVLLMGSESHGISKDLRSKVTQIISIPAYGNAESLNVAVATGILLDNIKRITDHQTIE